MWATIDTNEYNNWRGDCFTSTNTRIEDTLNTLISKVHTIEDYIEKTNESTKKKVEETKTMNEKKVKSIFYNMPKIKNIDFQPPLTVVVWEDGIKTFVKCAEGDEFDPEKGAAMAIAKRALGNRFDFIDTISYFVDRWYNKDVSIPYRYSYIKLTPGEEEIIERIRSFGNHSNEMEDFILSLFIDDELGE